MASVTIIQLRNLEPGKILSPERYDPRRSLTNHNEENSQVTIGQIVEIVKQTINPASKNATGRKFVVLDTSDIREGIVVGKKTPVTAEEIGSTKKIFRCHDVLISRLRPYLRQVAIIDSGFVGKFQNCEMACSTEFFILRSTSAESIDFLVPYLLSDRVQSALFAAQEGGHHPRFDSSVLLAIPIPENLLKQRNKISKSVSLAAELYRDSETLIHDGIAAINNL